MKRGFTFVILLVSLVLVSPLILGVDAQSDSLENNEVIKGVEKFQNFTDNAPKNTTEAKSYLMKEWEKIILKTPIIGKLYEFLIKVNLFFRIVFGESFTISLGFLIVILCWVYFTSRLQTLFNAAFPIGGLYSFPAGALGSIILANLGLYRGIVKVLDYLFSLNDSWIVWVVTAVVVLVISFGLKITNEYLAKYLKDKREAREKAKTEQSRKYVQKTAQGLQKGEDFGKKI